MVAEIPDYTPPLQTIYAKRVLRTKVFNQSNSFLEHEICCFRIDPVMFSFDEEK